MRSSPLNPHYELKVHVVVYIQTIKVIYIDIYIYGFKNGKYIALGLFQ